MNIVYITDMNMGGSNPAQQAVPRSGYANIGINLCRGLQNAGNDVKAIGLGYTGQEHKEPFSIIPCSNLQNAHGYVNNLKYMWEIDVVIVALDIHHFQEQIFPGIQKFEIPYICITPLESDPLCITWANLLSQMNKVFFISEMGAEEARKAGVEAEHIDIGMDTLSWRLRTEEEYQKVRQSMGYEKDDFVVLTVADNQERKDLSGGFEVIKLLKERGVSVKHVVVTREKSSVGWKLDDLAWTMGISPEIRVFQNGIPFEQLFMLYCAADAYMSCSKGEGLGLPVMEAMSVGVPVVANTTGALTELLGNDRGWLVPWEGKHIDPFGNQNRYYVDRRKMAEILHEVKNMHDRIDSVYIETVSNARKLMESKTWDKPVKQIIEAIEEIRGKEV